MTNYLPTLDPKIRSITCRVPHSFDLHATKEGLEWIRDIVSYYDYLQIVRAGGVFLICGVTNTPKTVVILEQIDSDYEVPVDTRKLLICSDEQLVEELRAREAEYNYEEAAERQYNKLASDRAFDALMRAKMEAVNRGLLI